MISHEQVEGFGVERRGGTVQHEQVAECNQKSWHLPEDCTLPDDVLASPAPEQLEIPGLAETMTKAIDLDEGAERIDQLLAEKATDVSDLPPKATIRGWVDEYERMNHNPDFTVGIADWLRDRMEAWKSSKARLETALDTVENDEGRGTQAKPSNPKDVLAQQEGRALLHLIPSPALIHVAKAMEDGARKYGPYNWREEGVGAGTYLSAARRHLVDWLDGEELAPDSEVHHLAHAAACCMILLDALAVGNLVDDRPRSAPTSEMMEAIKAGEHPSTAHRANEGGAS